MQRHRQFSAKRDVRGSLILVSTLVLDGRGLQLDPQIFTRALLVNEIHELIGTAEDVMPGAEVRDVAYLGFFEVQQGGMVAVDDELRISGRRIGVIAGFDLAHFPNHLNIVVRCGRRETGAQLGLGLDALVEIGGVLSTVGG